MANKKEERAPEALDKDTAKRLKKLSREDLLEILIEQNREIENLVREAEEKEARQQEEAKRKTEENMKTAVTLSLDEVTRKLISLTGRMERMENLLAGEETRFDRMKALARQQAKTAEAMSESVRQLSLVMVQAGQMEERLKAEEARLDKMRDLADRLTTMTAHMESGAKALIEALSADIKGKH